MEAAFFESPRAADRIAAARRFVEQRGPGEPFVVIGHRRHAADALAHEVAAGRGAAFGAYRYGLFVLAGELAAPELAERGIERTTPTARLATAVRVVHRARRGDTLGRFASVADGPGLAAHLARTFDELRLAGLDAPSVRSRDPELGALYDAYVEALSEIGLADRAETLAAATRRIGSGAGPLPAGLRTVFLDVPLGDRRTRDFAAALARKAPEAFFTLPTGDGRTAAAVRGFGARRTPVPDDEPRPEDAVGAAQWSLFTPRAENRRNEGPGDGRREISVAAAPGNAAEAVECARVFLAEAERGVPFDRMAVLLPNPNSQSGGFVEAFDRAGIPAFFESGTRQPHPAGRAFLALLDCALEGLSATRFAEYLSFGETPAPASESGERAPGYAAPRRWEKLILDSEVIGGLDRWERRLARFRERLEQDEAEEGDGGRRETIRARREDLERLTGTALPILKRLDGAPEASASFGEWKERLDGVARAALLHPEGVLECLAETAPMSEVGTVRLAEVRESLARRLTEVVTRSIGSRYGRVFVGPIEAARGLSFQVVAVAGLSERVFPRVIREDPMLLDQRRRELSPELRVRLDLGAEERLRLRVAVGAATRRLVLTWSSLDVVEGRPQTPSYYLAEVFRAGLGQIPTLDNIRCAAVGNNGVRRGIRAPIDAAAAIDRREFDLARVSAVVEGPPGSATPGACAYLVSDPALARALRQEYQRQSHKWSHPDGFLFPEAPARAALEAHRPGKRSYSATGLEAYATCPYRFFLKNLVRLRPVERPEALVHLDPLTRGSLLHDVFFHLGQQLAARGLAPLEEAQIEEAFRILEEVFQLVEAEVRERVAPAIPRVWKDQMDGLLGDLRGFLSLEKGTGRRTIANELTFGMGASQLSDPGSQRDPAALPRGLRLHGSIDAVDRMPDGTIQITDYKTGRSGEEAGLRSITEGGAMLQPLLYALAYEAISGEPVTSGRLYYATVRGAYRETVVKTGDSEARNVFEDFVSHLDRAVERGHFPALPDSNSRYPACASCDYLPVCGPRPAQHASVKRPAGLASVLDEISRVRQLP